MREELSSSSQSRIKCEAPEAVGDEFSVKEMFWLFTERFELCSATIFSGLNPHGTVWNTISIVHTSWMTWNHVLTWWKQMGCSNTPFNGSQMSFLDNGGGILQTEIFRKDVIFWAIYPSDKYICGSVIAFFGGGQVLGVVFALVFRYGCIYHLIQNVCLLLAPFSP